MRRGLSCRLGKVVGFWTNRVGKIYLGREKAPAPAFAEAGAEAYVCRR